MTHPEWKGSRDENGRPWLTCYDLRRAGLGPCCGSCATDEEYGSPPGSWAESPDKSIYAEPCCDHHVALEKLDQEGWNRILLAIEALAS